MKSKIEEIYSGKGLHVMQKQFHNCCICPCPERLRVKPCYSPLEDRIVKIDDKSTIDVSDAMKP
jgi:hypothetical protein